MATTSTQTVDLAQVLADLLDPLTGVRVYTYVSDLTRVPANGAAVVVMQPSVDYLDPQAAFCSATWTFPLMVVVARNSDREAQRALSRLLQEVTSTLGEAIAPDGILSIDPVDAKPTTATLSGMDLPAYAITVRVRA